MSDRAARQAAWMRQADAAKEFGIPKSTLATRIATRRYRSKVVHGLRLVSREDVEQDAAAQAA
jgi:predicted DNA-binding protein (UPF0251 family)